MRLHEIQINYQYYHTGIKQVVTFLGPIPDDRENKGLFRTESGELIFVHPFGAGKLVQVPDAEF